MLLADSSWPEIEAYLTRSRAIVIRRGPLLDLSDVDGLSDERLCDGRYVRREQALCAHSDGRRSIAGDFDGGA